MKIQYEFSQSSFKPDETFYMRQSESQFQNGLDAAVLVVYAGDMHGKTLFEYSPQKKPYCF